MIISNEKNEIFGEYCGQETGRSVTVTGYSAVIIFQSDGSEQKQGFLLSFTSIPAGEFLTPIIVRVQYSYSPKSILHRGGQCTGL